jgi:hypothetical protein
VTAMMNHSFHVKGNVVSDITRGAEDSSPCARESQLTRIMTALETITQRFVADRSKHCNNFSLTYD